MKVTDADLREALGHLPPGDGSRRDGCPSAEAIARDAEGAGTAQAEERPPDLREHVARCPACAFEYRLALSLRPWADGAASALRPSTTTRGPVRSRPAWWPPALAASLLLSVGLASWNLALRARSLDLRAELAETQRREAAARRLAERSPEPAAPGRGPDVAAPALNVPIVDLDTGGSRGASTAPIVLRIRRESPWVTFVLTVPGDPSEERHSIAIRSEDGRIVWEGGGLVANRFGTFTLAVPTSLLPAGRYRFLLSRPARDGAPRVVQTYHLVVSPPAP